MNAIATGIAGALISGVAMYAVGAKATPVNAFSQNPAWVQTVDGQFVPVNTTALQPAAAQTVTTTTTTTPINHVRRAPAPRRTVSRRAAETETSREVVREEAVRSERSWGKTAMIVGGSAASGAGVGGIVGGKKGALIGAAIGGGAASIYEATQRR
jgi:hypothetical protein